VIRQPSPKGARLQPRTTLDSQFSHPLLPQIVLLSLSAYSFHFHHMNIVRALGLISLLFMLPPTHAQNQLAVHIPTAEEEADYIWRTLQDIPFFETHNYQLSLPRGPLMEELKEKSRQGKLSDQDYQALQTFVKKRVYRQEDYQQGYDNIQEQLPLLNLMLSDLKATAFKWDFHTFDTYRINLTLYGPGGSYDPDQGSVLIYTTPQGLFKQYKNPANTLIHEIIHIGIEASIVQALQLSHPLKERIVDTFVSVFFGEKLPTYRIQNMGEDRTDALLETREDFRNLAEIVEELVSKE